MRRNTSVNVDEGVVNNLRELGFTLTGFTQTAVDVVLSEGFDDFAVALKLKLLEEEEQKLEEEISRCESKLRYLNMQLGRSHELHDIMVRNYEASERSAIVCKLVDELNSVIIINGYDIDAVVRKSPDLIKEIQSFNPDFILEKHIERIRKLVS